MTRVPPCLPLRKRIARAKPALEGRLLRRAPGVATIAVLLVGCTSRPVAVPRPGDSLARPARAGVVIAAVSGSAEVAEIASEIGRRTGFAVVIGGGDDSYERRVREAARGPVAFSVEIRGRSASAERIDVAAVGVDAEQALKLRTLLELTRDAHVRARPDGRHLQVRVEAVEAAAPAPPSTAPRALRIELPRLARADARELCTAILADFLREAVALPLPARR